MCQEVGCGGRWDLGLDDLWTAQRGFSCDFQDDTARRILCLVTDALKSFCAAPVASNRGHGRETLVHDGRELRGPGEAAAGCSGIVSGCFNGVI